MHYKNGREAKNGDKVVLLPSYGPPVAGILYDAQAGNDYCNGRIAITTASDPCPNLKECLRADDISAAGLPSRFQLGDAVRVQKENQPSWTGTVSGIRFSAGKVHYDVDTSTGATEECVDSAFVSPPEE